MTLKPGMILIRLPKYWAGNIYKTIRLIRCLGSAWEVEITEVFQYTSSHVIQALPATDILAEYVLAKNTGRENYIAYNYKNRRSGSSK